MSNEVIIEEYRVLRAEIQMRAKLLHQLATMVSIFWLVLIISAFWLQNLLTQALFIDFLLLIPLIFTWLTFNYQDNQRTMERAAKYIDEVLNPKLNNELTWERWFASQKKIYQFSSSFKVLGLLFPFILPIIIFTTQALTNYQTSLGIFDLVLFIIVLINFRYKLYRVK